VVNLGLGLRLGSRLGLGLGLGLVGWVVNFTCVTKHLTVRTGPKYSDILH